MKTLQVSLAKLFSLDGFLAVRRKVHHSVVLIGLQFIGQLVDWLALLFSPCVSQCIVHVHGELVKVMSLGSV